MDITPELVAWTREALERLFDLSFLGNHIRAPLVRGRFVDSRTLQEALLDAIKQLSPPAQASPQSLVRRIYAVLNLRYVQGLTQAEAAAELMVGLRHLRREQDRAVRAVAVFLFERPAQVAQVESESAIHTRADARSDANARLPDLAESYVTMPLDELLRGSLDVFEPLLKQRDLQVKVTLPSPLPMARANPMTPMAMRQLFISGLAWMVQSRPGSLCEVRIAVEADAVRADAMRGEWLIVSFVRPTTAGAAAGTDEFDTFNTSNTREEQETITQLAELAHAEVAFRTLTNHTQSIEIRLPANARHTVLMVDDNLDAIRLARRYLEQCDEFDLVTTSHPDETMQLARRIRPACILLDVMMPEHDGWELLTHLKADPATASTPIIITSILTDHGLARALGASSFLSRPFTAAQLIAALRSAMARSIRYPAQQSA